MVSLTHDMVSKSILNQGRGHVSYGGSGGQVQAPLRGGYTRGSTLGGVNGNNMAYSSSGYVGSGGSAAQFTCATSLSAALRAGNPLLWCPVANAINKIAGKEVIK